MKEAKSADELPPGAVVSPTISIRLLDAQGEEIPLSELPPGRELVFSLYLSKVNQGVDQQLMAEPGVTESVTDPCASHKAATCAWWDKDMGDSGDWSFVGCTSHRSTGNGTDAQAITCVCTHATEFALVVRAEKGAMSNEECSVALANPVHYALAAAYFMAACAATFQFSRLVHKETRRKEAGGMCARLAANKLVAQHAALAILCLGRVAVLVLRASRLSAAVLVLLACIPYVLEYATFTDLARSFLRVTFSMKQELLKILLRVSAGLVVPVLLIAVAFPIIIFVLPAGPLRTDLAVAASYTMAGVVIAFCLALLVGGLIVVAQLRKGRALTTTASSASRQRLPSSSSTMSLSGPTMSLSGKAPVAKLSASSKLIIFTLLLAVSLMLQSVCWVLSVQQPLLAALGPDFALGVDIAFYVLGLVNVLGLLFLRAAAVAGCVGPLKVCGLNKELEMMEREAELTDEFRRQQAQDKKSNMLKQKELERELTLTRLELQETNASHAS